jgi:hypothetical protein
MPIYETPFVKSLQHQYGKRWKQVYFAMRSKNPQNPAILEAEGMLKRHKIHKII